MRYDQADNNRRGRFWAALWTAGFYLTAVLLAVYVRFSMRAPELHPLDEGVMVNFGDVAEAGGAEDTPLSDELTRVPSVKPPVAEVRLPVRPATPKTAVNGTPGGDVPIADAKPAEQPRTADPRALFPGRTAGSTSASEGTGTGQGNQGNPAGTAEGSHSGTGTGTSGTSFNLAGRSIVGSLPKPAYDGRREGKVIVEITVDPQGNVTNAVYRATGSTTNESSLVTEALRAARKARFNVAEGENLQTGTITYVFKMN